MRFRRDIRAKPMLFNIAPAVNVPNPVYVLCFFIIYSNKNDKSISDKRFVNANVLILSIIFKFNPSYS